MSKGEIKNPLSGPSSDKRLECLTSLDREVGEIKQFNNNRIGCSDRSMIDLRFGAYSHSGSVGGLGSVNTNIRRTR